MAERAAGVALADARQPEREHIDALLDEVTAGELAQLLAEERREALVVEIGEGLARREFGRAPQSVDATLAAISCLQLEDLEQVRKQIAVTCRSQTGYHLARRGRQLERR